jgi:hypothetical protein
VDDIALVKLDKSPWVWPQAVCLEKELVDEEGTEAVIAGYGKDDLGGWGLGLLFENA